MQYILLMTCNDLYLYWLQDKLCALVKPLERQEENQASWRDTMHIKAAKKPMQQGDDRIYESCCNSYLLLYFS